MRGWRAFSFTKKCPQDVRLGVSEPEGRRGKRKMGKGQGRGMSA
jgi:hypothetical protein